MIELSKTKLNTLRIKYNKLVRAEYRISKSNQRHFNDWFYSEIVEGEDLGANYDGAPFFSYIEISGHAPISGHAEIFEL